MIANLVADSLGGESGVFASDDDPELVREAIPFGLKAIESLLDGSPDNPKLLLAAASGFAQYAYGFVLVDAEEMEGVQPVLARAKKARAKKLLVRAVEYGMRGIEARHAGFRALFAADRAKAMTGFDKGDVPLLYWTGAALGALVSISQNDMAMLGRLPEVEALMGRALELDEGFGGGAIHEFFVNYDGGRSESMGGSFKRAKEHFERALALSNGKKIGVLVAWAEVVAVQKQDRRLFDEMLSRALEFNVDEEPRFRLANLIAQRRARLLKSRAPELFVED
ncbi:MAG: hypothetical protein HY897_23730 [Deltaproteobacteria bacterium]|nr:hypothetical protein [Deltaproteobacteria bacterium]